MNQQRLSEHQESCACAPAHPLSRFPTLKRRWVQARSNLGSSSQEKAATLSLSLSLSLFSFLSSALANADRGARSCSGSQIQHLQAKPQTRKVDQSQVEPRREQGGHRLLLHEHSHTPETTCPNRPSYLCIFVKSKPQARIHGGSNRVRTSGEAAKRASLRRPHQIYHALTD